MSSEHQYQQKLGKGMITIAWIILLILLTALFSGFLDQQEFPNADLQTFEANNGRAVVVLEMNRSGHYIAPGKINNVPVRFLLDTGATDVAIPEKLASKIGLQKGHRTLSQTANGTVNSYATTIERISLGGIELENIRASIFPGMPGGEVLLGMSFLKHLEMNQKGRTLTLRQ